LRAFVEESASVVSCLRASGHTVVRYDFLGHGWSVASELWLQQDSKVLLSQLQDVLVHVLNNKTASKTAAGQVESLKTVETFVGHSTGGQKKKEGEKRAQKQLRHS
jgi:pimeloyl-ACP methyl ester carboxylesterase